MIIVRAKGFAKEVLQTIYNSDDIIDIVFYDEVTVELPHKLFGRYNILKSLEEVESYFKTIDNRFTICIGDSILRKKMYYQFSELGGIFTSTISSKLEIGIFDVTIGYGANLFAGVVLSNSVTKGLGSLIYFNSILTHDVVLGDFVQISPSLSLLGRCSVGSSSIIVRNTLILPYVCIDKNVIVGAGLLVTTDVPDDTLLYRVPATIKKKLTKSRLFR
jgi:acetyltransferase-like isoleucine patch superfamily enzyme